MERNKGSTRALSASQSKRSSTNLSNLRLAPLSTKYVDLNNSKKTASTEQNDNDFVRSHSSYLQGKSAPTTPGILSRSSSRRKLHGMSRRSSIYDNEPSELISYEYSGVEGSNAPPSNRPLPKAKSEAALLVRRNRLAQRGTKSPDEQRQRHHSRRTTGTGGSLTPKGTTSSKYVDENWILRTGMAANAIVQESKGQSWMSSRPSSTSFQNMQDLTDGEDDEGYEEMAALSTNPARLQQTESQRGTANARTSGWGSRYGSRTGSRRTSRRGSFVGVQTPLAAAQDGSADYFGGSEYGTSAIVPDFVDSEEDLDSQDEASINRIVDGKTFGLGGFVDRLMNFNLFKVEEKEEGTDDDRRQQSDSSAQAVRPQMQQQAKDRTRSEDQEQQDAQAEGGWSDAAWLVSVAAKAMF